jgi:hypothetical protein
MQVREQPSYAHFFTILTYGKIETTDCSPHHGLARYGNSLFAR